MVERPPYATKQRINKLLLYPDGRNRCAQIGMVDERGASLYMLDSDTTEHFAFTDENTALMQLSDELSTIKRERDALQEQLDKLRYNFDALRLLTDRTLDFATEMRECGEFSRAHRKRISNVMSSLNTRFDTIKRRDDDAAQ